MGGVKVKVVQVGDYIGCADPELDEQAPEEG